MFKHVVPKYIIKIKKTYSLVLYSLVPYTFVLLLLVNNFILSIVKCQKTKNCNTSATPSLDDHCTIVRKTLNKMYKN